MKTNIRITMAAILLSFAFIGCAHGTDRTPVTTPTHDEHHPDTTVQPFAMDHTQSEMMTKKTMEVMDPDHMKDMRHACMQSGDSQMKCDKKMMQTCTHAMSKTECKKMMKQSKAEEAAMKKTK